MIKLYNTLTRSKDELRPVKQGEVGIYSCGPTVYWNQHIGHMYAYVQWDLLIRFLRSINYKVRWVMNITDVGHMTSDEDVGEDKMEKGAKREGVSVWQIANKYIAQFLDSMDALNITRPDVLCRATEHIQEQIDLIKRMEENGFTYRTKTGIVFDTSKFPDYAKFANLKLDKQEAGSRVEVDPEKKNPWDFLLWVTNQPDHIMKWDSPWGVGFPGWHIECTAMSTKYLGNNFDIHTGGKEHVGVHHTNEIAQGYGAFGYQTANYWLHNEWLMLKGEKISKSLGNMVLVADIINKGFDPMALRYFILNSHYRTGADFTWEGLTAASTALTNLRKLVYASKNETSRTVLSVEKDSQVEKFRIDFENALSDDLNAPLAIAVLWNALKSNIPSEDKYDLAVSFDEVLGLKLTLYDPNINKKEITSEVKDLIKKRDDARSKSDYKLADTIRKNIEKLGYKVLDTPEGTLIE